MSSVSAGEACSRHHVAMGKYQNRHAEVCIRKGIHLPKKQCPYLTNYLKDGRLALSNSWAERRIKPFVIYRKNFLFANTPKFPPVVQLCSA